ncbi:caspase family protein [Hyphomicrobium sp.]|uniref:outer membrane protein assembly factor BamB family protein n=1 Tax=Hyphomicrobium sp. TaxID=82 RepID=UPI0025BA561B|nr:caspase family protein [Hyphomicrobium sp.]
MTNTAKINRVSADDKCSIIATASEDKTARVYRGDGTLLSILRPPIGPGNGGKLRAVAVSPDGRLVATGGWDVAVGSTQAQQISGATMNNGVYIFDAQSGSLVKRIENFPYDIKNLVFSSDGKRLAVTMGGNVYVLDTEGFKPIFHDGSLEDMPYGVAFGPDYTLYVASLDGSIRKYNPKGRLVLARRFNRLGRVYGLVADPSGRYLLTSSIDVAGAIYFDAATLKIIGQLNPTGLTTTPLGILAGTIDGNVAGGGAWIDSRTGVGILRIWHPSQTYTDFELHNDSVAAITGCGSGFVFATYSQTLTRIDAEGKIQWKLQSANYSAYEKKGKAFLVSKDGRRVWFGLGRGAEDPVEFDLANERLFKSPVAGDGLFPAVDNVLPVTGWDASGDPRLGSLQLYHETDETFRSMAQLPNGGGFVLGSEFQLWAYDQTGKVVWRVKPPAPVHGANITRDGRLLVAAYNDGTIRWHRLTDGAELLALYLDRKTLAWIAWTPTGYFMSSPGGDNLGGWQINRGFHQSADFFPMSRFRDRFYRPDIVKLVLAKLDERAAIEAANAASDRKPAPLNPDVSEQLPPVIAITSPIDGSLAQPGTVSANYELRSPSGDPVNSIEVLIDGRPIDVKQTPPQATSSGATVLGKIDIPLPQTAYGKIEIGLIAQTPNRRSAVAKIALQVNAPQSDDLKPSLFALVVGISNYQASGIQPLQYAAKDAQDFRDLLQRQANGLYGAVEVKMLTDQGAKTGMIKEGLQWLADQVTRHDVGVVFLAGHGETDSRNRFWFLTADTDKAHLAATALSKEDIDVTLQSLRGRVVVFLDACHAGNAASDQGEGSVDTNALLGELSATGQDMVIFSSSSGREVSYESPDWKNGVFTKSVIEAIADGKADLFKTGRITSSLLDAYAAKRVGDLTGGRQHPLMFRPRDSADFDIAVVR